MTRARGIGRDHAGQFQLPETLKLSAGADVIRGELDDIRPIKRGDEGAGGRRKMERHLRQE